MYVMKNGEVIFQSLVSGIDNVTFDEAASDDALIIHKNENSPAYKILLNNILQLSFSEENLSVKTSNDNKAYAFNDISKLFFGDNAAEIKNLSLRSGFDVLLSFTPAGDVVVESSVGIKSLTLFSIDGKLISKQYENGVETQCTVPLQDKIAAVYLLRVETGQGAIVKKIVKPSTSK